MSLVVGLDFAIALKAQLVARFAAAAGMEDVKVYLVPQNDDIPIFDTVVLMRTVAPEDGDYVNANRERDVVATIGGVLYAIGRDQATDNAAETAALRGIALINEIVAEVRDHPPQVGLQTRAARVSNFSPILLPVDTVGHACKGRFTMIVKARAA